MRTIWKFPVTISDSQNLLLPEDFEILTVQKQGDYFFLWAEIYDTNSRKANVEVRVYGTGNPMPDDPGHYIATVQDGFFVWHFYVNY